MTGVVTLVRARPTAADPLQSNMVVWAGLHRRPKHARDTFKAVLAASVQSCSCPEPRGCCAAGRASPALRPAHAEFGPAALCLRALLDGLVHRLSPLQVPLT